jgi:hypothetical protein
MVPVKRPRRHRVKSKVIWYVYNIGNIRRSGVTKLYVSTGLRSERQTTRQLARCLVIELMRCEASLTGMQRIWFHITGWLELA